MSEFIENQQAPPAVSDMPFSPRGEFIRGAKDVAPILIGVIPFALIAGVVAVEAGLSIGQSLLLNWGVFAGAAQLAALQLLGEDAAFITIIITVLIVNLRFMMFSASLAPHFRELKFSTKAIVAQLLVDQAYLLSILRFEDKPQNPHKVWYYLGTALPMWVIWLSFTATGIFVGAQVPPEWSLDFTIPLMFIAVGVPAIKGKANTAAAIAASTAAVITVFMPNGFGFLIAALTGIGVGMLVEWRSEA